MRCPSTLKQMEWFFQSIKMMMNCCGLIADLIYRHMRSPLADPSLSKKWHMDTREKAIVGIIPNLLIKVQ